MFYTNKVKMKTEDRFKAMENLYQVVMDKNIELIEKNKSLFEKLVILDNRIDKLEKDNISFNEKIVRINDISLILGLINQGGIGSLKSNILKPEIEAKHRENRINEGQNIVNQGQKIIEDRNALHTDIIQRQKKGEDITRLKMKLDIYNEILEKIKEKK